MSANSPTLESKASASQKGGYCQKWREFLLRGLTPHFVGLEDGWLSPGSEFRSFGAVLLTLFSLSLLKKIKYLLPRLFFFLFFLLLWAAPRGEGQGAAWVEWKVGGVFK